MKVLNGSITKCECGTVMEYDKTDVVPAIECPVCKKLTKVDLPVEKDIGFDNDSVDWVHKHIGAIKQIELKNGCKLKVQVAHKKDDSVFLAFYDLLTNDGDGYAMNSTRTTKGGYKDCEVREYLNGDFLELLPDDLVKRIVATKVDVGNGEFVEDKIFLPSEYEIFGRKIYGQYEEGEQFDLFKDWHNRIAGGPDDECGRWYWTRSVHSAEYFCYVSNDGYANYNGAGNGDYLRPLFQIK